MKNDFGSGIWSSTIIEIRNINSNCTIEVLTPDFRNYYPAYNKVFRARPDIFSHNIECVKRISKNVRPQSDWDRSISVLEASVKFGLKTKTGLMVGLGETDKEVLDTMQAHMKLQNFQMTLRMTVQLP